MLRVDEESPHDPTPMKRRRSWRRLSGICRRAMRSSSRITQRGRSGPRSSRLRSPARAPSASRSMSIRKATDFARYRGATCIAPNLRELAAAAQHAGRDRCGDRRRRDQGHAGSGGRGHPRDPLGKGHGAGRSLRRGAYRSRRGRARSSTCRAPATRSWRCWRWRAPAAIRCRRRCGSRTPPPASSVSKLGTATVELDELMLELSRDVRDKDWHRAKYYTAAEAETLVRRWKSRGLKRRLHQWLLRYSACRPCRAAGGGARRMRPPDRRAQYRPRRAPAQGTRSGRSTALEDRSAVIAAVESVDAVISFDEETPIELIRRLEARRAGQGRRLHGRGRGRRRGGAGGGRPGGAGRSRRGAFDDAADRGDPQTPATARTRLGARSKKTRPDAGGYRRRRVYRLGARGRAQRGRPQPTSSSSTASAATRNGATSPSAIFSRSCRSRRCIAWLERFGGEVEAIFHLGAISATTFTDADEMIANNLNYSIALWRWCAAAKKPLIYASSAATYGDGTAGFDDAGGIDAFKRLRPMNLYGWSKHAFDLWALRAGRRGSGAAALGRAQILQRVRAERVPQGRHDEPRREELPQGRGG